jgi:hypothetical protein
MRLNFMGYSFFEGGAAGGERRKRRRQIIILIFSTVFSGSLLSQTTFNLRERYDFEACVLTSVIPTDSCYYATGVIADTVFPYKTGAIFIKFDTSFNPQIIKTLRNPVKSYEPWYNALVPTMDGGFFTVGNTLDTVLKSILIKYDATGDTVFTREFLNPYYPNANISPWGGAQLLQDGGLIISNWIATSNSPFGNDTNFYIIRTDSLGNKIWDKIFSTVLWERPESIGLTKEGNIIIGGIKTNQTTNVQNYTFQCHLFQVDTAGNLDWAWTSPNSIGLRDAANDMLLLDDGSIIVASGIGHEQVRASVNEVYFDRHVFKLNPQKEIEWELTFKDSALTDLARTTNLVKLNDGSGYIVAGMTYNAQPPPKYFTIRGWFAKISNEGDSLWTRRYAFLTDGENQHTVYDMKETPDGGLIICGQALSWKVDATYPQQAWLLKLDPYGCLVPGCHLIDATEETKPEIKLAVYPNPASDYLNFYLRTPSPVREASFRIVNAAGAVVREFKNEMPGATYMVPVWDWAAGVYFLQYLESGKVMSAEKFIKQ